MLGTLFPPWPSFTEEEVDAVQRVLLSNKVNYWTGTETREFETEFARFAGCEYAIALANGTLALELALHALNLSPGDEVIVTPRTFIASVSSVISAGATPVFVDVDENTQNIEADSISKGITKRTRAVIVVHLAGMPADMDPIMELAEENSLSVIEDCAQAHGASYKGRPVGSIGHIAAWSFCQDKIMTTGGEGGMVTTNDEELWSSMWSHKDHGKNWDSIYNKEHRAGFRWIHDSFGTNWRMTEMQGVLGRIQTKRMPAWHEKRISNAKQIWSTCQKLPWLRVPVLDTPSDHAAYKAYVFVRPELLPSGWTRDSILAALSAEDVPVYSGSCSEVYLEKAFENSEYRQEVRLPVAKRLGETSLMFLVHPTLEQEHIDVVIAALQKVDGLMRGTSIVDE